VAHNVEKAIGGDGVTLDETGAHLRHGRGWTCDGQVDLAGYQVLHDQRGATIGHKLKSCARRLLEKESGNMPDAADAGRSIGRFVGIGIVLDSLSKGQSQQGFDG
jgi:hypothetical protein